MDPSPVVVTGLGCVCAAGGTVAESMEALYSGKRSVIRSNRVHADIEKISPVFEVPAGFFGNSESAGEVRTTSLLKTATQEALFQADFSGKILQSKRVGVAIGTTVGCTLNSEPFYRAYKAGKNPGLQPVRQFLENNPASSLQKKYTLTGPAITVANACSSGTDAIGLAKSWIEAGLCDVVIAGGADELCRITYLGFTSLQITSIDPCAPFDKNRKGLNLGEGAGVVVLESLNSAQKRGVPILAFIAGYGCSADAYHPTAPHPEGLGLRRAMEYALTEAGMGSHKPAFVNAHGTSTRDNDTVEGRVLFDFFGNTVPVVSTKSYTGHTLGAAGGIEAVFSVMGLAEKKIPATIGFNEPDSECAISPTTENTTISGEFALSNSLAFGGNNAVLVFQRGNAAT